MKKELLVILITFWPINILAEVISSHQIGNTTYYSDGTRINQVGNTYYTNRGVRFNQVGNTVYGSNGTRISKVGNTYYTNYGKTYNKIGNTIFGSDGSRISNIGNTTYYSNSRYFSPVGYTPAIKRPVRSMQLSDLEYNNYYDDGYSYDTAIAAGAGAVAGIALGAMIGNAVSENNNEVKRKYYNHLINFEQNVMNKKIN